MGMTETSIEAVAPSVQEAEDLVARAKRDYELARQRADAVRQQAHEIEQAARTELERVSALLSAAEDRVAALELYQGIGESIELIHDGSPAPPTTPWRVYERIATTNQDLMAVSMLRAVDDPDIDIDRTAKSVEGIDAG